MWNHIKRWCEAAWWSLVNGTSDISRIPKAHFKKVSEFDPSELTTLEFLDSEPSVEIWKHRVMPIYTDFGTARRYLEEVFVSNWGTVIQIHGPSDKPTADYFIGRLKPRWAMRGVPDTSSAVKVMGSAVAWTINEIWIALVYRALNERRCRLATGQGEPLDIDQERRRYDTWLEPLPLSAYKGD